MILILGHCYLTNATKMFAMHIFLFCTMLMAATHLMSVSQNFTGSGSLIPSMLRIFLKITLIALPVMFSPYCKTEWAYAIDSYVW